MQAAFRPSEEVKKMNASLNKTEKKFIKRVVLDIEEYYYPR